MTHDAFAPAEKPDEMRPVTALMLTGGGSRAAYQVGVLEAIADIRKEAGAIAQPNPFPIITGTSAGAINAATPIFLMPVNGTMSGSAASSSTLKVR